MKYKVTLEMAGQEYKGEGESVNQAMSALPIDWTNIKGKGVLTVYKGKHFIQKIFYLAQMRRMFGNKLGKVFRTVWANRFELHLKELYDHL